ncbi:MAG: TaqI-like C-terminal specificity domain-containing protein [Sulfurovum sp.]
MDFGLIHWHWALASSKGEAEATHPNNSKDDFYTQILQEIFFEALNKKRKDDYFKLLDCKMPFLNGGLFAKDKFDTLDIIIENSIFEKIFKVFDRYNFTIIEGSPNDSEVAIDPEMLGRVFEDLLEDRKDKGAFYTPREIVHYMCKESLNNYIDDNKTDEEKLEQLKNIKVLDPAIGSGAFPMGMLHEIIKLRQELGDETQLGKLKKDVIENSIYGIDIESSAVEIAKLRFWLSIVVDEETPSPLPNLAYKIMVGNSLLETINGFDPFEKIEKADLFTDNDNIEKVQALIHKYFNENNNTKKIKIDKEINQIIDSQFQFKISEYEEQINLKSSRLNIGSKREQEKLVKSIEEDYLNLALFTQITKEKPTTELFFYKLYFAEVIGEGGFDVVIGNPPYLRVQGIDKDVSIRYKNQFESATGSYDLYILFIEKGLELLAPKGILNYIIPHKWINSSFGKGIRGLSKNNLTKFISFGAYQVFNASTYTSLVWFKKEDIESLKYIESNKDLSTNIELEKYLFGLKEDDYTHIKNSELTVDSWIFTDKETYNILEKLKRQDLRVSDIFEKIFTGLQTAKDSVYFIKDCKYKDNLVIGFSEELNKEIQIEIGLVKPLLKGNDVHRYEKLQSNKVVIFPYYIKDKKAILYTEEEIKEIFPYGYSYLKECEEILRGRERGRFNIDGEWFQLGRKQGMFQEIEKLITPYLSLGSQLSYDKNGEFYGNTKCFGLIKFSKIKESYKFYLAILNSKLMWFFIKNTSAVFSGGYYTYTKDSLSSFPIPKIKNIEDTKPFEILVDYVMLLKTLDTNIDKYADNENIIKYHFEEVLDALVYELYFKDEFKDKNIEFLKYAKEYFKPIDNLEDEEKIETIHKSYLLLIERHNKIRNNLELMTIRLKDLILPIKRSL